MIQDNYNDFDPVDDCWHMPTNDLPETDEPLLLVYRDCHTYRVSVSSRIYSYYKGGATYPKTDMEWAAANCYDIDNRYLCDWLDVVAWAYLDELVPAKISKDVRRDYRHT